MGDSVSRAPGDDGQKVERIESSRYEIRDSDGNRLGSAHINTNNASVSLEIYGFSTVEEGVERLKELLGIEE